MTQTDDFGAELADFVRRVAELRAARALPPDEHLAVLDAALFELRHVADTLWPRYERLKAVAPNAPSPDRQERQERQLLKALFQRLPVPVALVDRETVVRRMNFAATGLTGVRAGYATGRPLAALLSPGDRAAFRSQAAAVARGEGDRSLAVHLQQRPDDRLLATLTALRPPDETHPAVLVVFQNAVSGRRAGAYPSTRAVAAGRRRTALPDLRETTRYAERLDLVDAMTTALLSAPPEDPEAALEAAARVLHERFADWVVADVVAGGPIKRTLVLGPGGEDLAQVLAGQDPSGCPLVVEAARGGSATLQVRPEDTAGFGHDPAGDPVLVRADVTSLLCVPLTAPGADGAGAGSTGPVQGVLTLFRTGPRRAFSMAEGQVMDLMSRHAALAMRRPAGPRRADGCSSG
ncbi:PAS domain-containing protein [Streptomyces albidochromogenes]|uniref:PAS domain-containing protein n=1 Tax=Streptomyces albidochromogenes TaxID=329524 RepID=A0ABW6FX27_9ACTN